MTPDVWSSIDAFVETFIIPIRILITIALALIVRAIALALIEKTARRVTSDSKKRRERIQNAASAGKKPPREFPLSPLAAERVVQRTRALASLSRNVITVVVFTLALMLILGELGVNITALLASAGIVAAGLAFGAQNVVKDIINGVFMVAEDQIGVGDSVIIGEIEGTVEVVGIRVTQVRAYDGTLWFIRNGEILRLGNHSHGWGRAVLDVSVDPESDLTRVQSLLGEVLDALAHDPELQPKITSKPELVSGLQQVSEDRITVRASIKTVPDAQDDVERALRTALKVAFDNAGIRFAPEKSAFILRTGYGDDQQ